MRPMRGKWAAGIQPRNFAWIIKDKLAVSERPGGYARNHRKVRRQEEIIWLREQGFTRIVSLLPSSHNLHAYEELGVPSTHYPLPPGQEIRDLLAELYGGIRHWVASGEKVLLHQEELGDRLMGVVSGYLLWTKMLDSGPQAIAVIEQIVHKQMGPAGREIVALVPTL
jgi:hypothetical protein